MKRITAWILTLAMALSCALLLASPAQAAEGDIRLLGQEVTDDGSNYEMSVRSFCVAGDTLYLLTRDGSLYTYKEGDADAAPYLTGINTNQYDAQLTDTPNYVANDIFSDGGTLYGLYMDKGLLFTIAAGADGKPVYGEPVALDFDSFITVYGEEEEEAYVSMQFYGMDIMDGTLYMSGVNYDVGEEDPTLYAFDIKTGARKTFASKTVYAFCPYKDGQLLCMVTGGQDTMYNRDTQSYNPWTLCAFDPAADTLTPLATVDGDKYNYYNVAGFRYDPAADTLYFATTNKIHRMVAFAAPELCAYTPVSSVYAGETDSALFAGRYVITDSYGAYLRVIDPALLPTQTLSIYNHYADNAHRKAAAAMDDIPIFFFDESYYSSAQELGQALAGGESQIDLLRLDVSWMDFTRLMSKGYCHDLSGYTELAAFADTLYPFIQDAVKWNGKLFAIPMQMYGSGFGYIAKNVEALGIPVPNTYIELMETINAFAQPENEDTWAEYAPMEVEGEYREVFISAVLEAYDEYMAAQGEMFTLDTPTFRQLLTAADAMDTENIEVIGGWDDATGEPSEELMAFWEKPKLFETWTSYNASHYTYENRATAHPLSLTGAEEPVVAMDLSVFFINPRSKNIDAAIRYLNAYIAAMDKVQLTEMCPDRNEPVENAYYERSVRDQEAALARQQELIDKAAPADKQMLQEEYDRMAGYLQEYKEKNRYDATAESIAAYRELMRYAVVAKPSMIWTGSSDGDSFWNLMRRFMDKQMPLEQFIQEGNGKLRLMQLERD